MVRGLLRQHHGGHAAVSNLELFFDLVYVFAITQIAQSLHTHLTLAGLGQAVILFLAVWWAWIFTSWSTNWADPDSVPVRLMMLANMLASLVMAALLPRAFDNPDHATAFAATYCLVQIGRTLFMVWAMARERPAGARNMLRIACWFVASAPLWLIGARTGTQVALWSAALALEYAGPFAFFRVPFLGRSTNADWDISGSHLAERASLFVLIALGEGIVETGAAFAEGAPTLPRVLAFLACFAGSVLMWWIYFDIGAGRGADHIAHSPNAGRIARNAYTYLHLPIVGSVVVTAVADTLLMEHPQGPATPALVAVCGGGLIVYLSGMALFKRFSSPLGNLPLSHLVGLALLGALIAAGHAVVWPAVAFTGACAAVLLLVAVWEWGSFHGGWVRK
jgi:low temperature requirement protein LtrA